MIFEFQFWPTATVVGVMLSWLGFLVIFISRKQLPRTRAEKRDHLSWVGMALQSLSYGIALVVWRSPFTPIVQMPEPAQAVLAISATALSFASVGVILAAIHALGKQWSYGARLIQGHKLVIAGPYTRVRHPIYTGMLGMLLATGFALSRWYALAAAVLVFFAGTAIRIRSEEKLLREAFGDDFAAYARYIPAIFPRMF